MAIEVTAYGRTDVGRVRRSNEDVWVVVDLSTGESRRRVGPLMALELGPRGVLLAVCDGVGGADAGEVASSLALESLCRTLVHSAVGSEPGETLRWGVDKANRDVWMAAQEPGRQGMAATLAAVLVLGAHAYVAGVGDSRVYVLRGSRLVQLTRDQSYVQRLVDSGMSRERAMRSPKANVLLQAVGKEPEVPVALGRLALRRGDRLLVCSDGLWCKLRDDEIQRLVEQAPTLDAACAGLVQAANDRGGEDNVTVVLAAVGGEPLPPADPEEDPSSSLETLRLG